MARNGTLSPKQRKAIAALLSERDVKSAAEAAGVALRTMFRWMDDPDFQAELKAAESAAISSAIRRLAHLSGTAVNTLQEIMESEKDLPPGARVKGAAANIVLSRLIPLKELADLESRLAAVEEALRNQPER